MDNFGQMLGESLADVDLSNPINMSHPLARGLVGFWLPLPSLAGGMKLYDLTRYRNHGTLTNMDPRTDWVNTERGIALDFDGVDDKVVISETTLPTSYPVTAIINIKPISWNDYAIFFTSYAAGFSIGSVSGTPPTLAFRATTGADVDLRTSKLTDNQWTHIVSVLTSTDGVAAAYLDGVSVIDEGGTGWDILAGTFISTRSSGIYPLEGAVREAMIYNRALSSSDVYHLYKESSSGFPTLLNRRRRWWPVSASVPPSQTILDYERGFARGFSRGFRVGAT